MSTRPRRAPPAPTSSPVAFGERLRALRLSADLTQAALAERSGLDVSYVSQMERGLRDPSLSSIEALASGLGLSLSEFFDDSDDNATTNLARSLAAELAPLDALTRRDAVDIVRRLRGAVERAAPRRRP